MKRLATCVAQKSCGSGGKKLAQNDVQLGRCLEAGTEDGIKVFNQNRHTEGSHADDAKTTQELGVGTVNVARPPCLKSNRSQDRRASQIVVLLVRSLHAQKKQTRTGHAKQRQCNNWQCQQGQLYQRRKQKSRLPTKMGNALYNGVAKVARYEKSSRRLPCKKYNQQLQDRLENRWHRHDKPCPATRRLDSSRTRAGAAWHTTIELCGIHLLCLWLCC